MNSTHAKSIALSFLVLAGLLQAVRAEIIEQVLFKVNGEIFTKTDLEARQVAALRQLGQSFDPTAALGDAQLRRMLDEITPEIVVGVVDEMLIVQQGRELGYRLSDEQFASIVDNIRKENKLENEEQFQAALEQENMTTDDLRRNLERQMIVSRVQQNEVGSGVAVSVDEARRYYDARKDEFTSPRAVTLREILVAGPGEGTAGAQDAAAEANATQIRERALAGESFEKLAGALSVAPSRANAGLVGPLDVDELSPELRKLIDTMKPGDVSEVLRTPRGYQILKLESMTAPETMPFEEARDQISERLFAEKRMAEFQKYLARLRSEAILEWKSPELKKAYERGLEQAKAGNTVLQ